MDKLSSVERREVALAIETKIAFLEPSDEATAVHKRIANERIAQLRSALSKLVEEAG